MNGDKWVGKFKDIGLDEIPDKPEPVVRTYKAGRGRSGKADVEKDRHERAFADATGRTGRVERALRLWKAGMVTQVEDAKDDSGHILSDMYQVQSQTDKHNSYMVMEGLCHCGDKDHNGGQECKHELAVIMYKGDEIDGIKYTL